MFSVKNLVGFSKAYKHCAVCRRILMANSRSEQYTGENLSSSDRIMNICLVMNDVKNVQYTKFAIC